MSNRFLIIILTMVLTPFLQSSDKESDGRLYIFNCLKSSINLGHTVGDRVDKLFANEKYSDFCNDQDQHGNTLLHYSIKSFDVNASLQLIGKGASVHVRNKLELTPLHYAMIYRASELVFHGLLDAGSDVQAKDVYGISVLHRAVIDENTLYMQELIKRGADVNSFDNNGSSVLKEAVSSGKLRVLQMLLDADVIMEDGFLDKTDVAIVHMKPDMRTVLEAYREQNK